VRPIHAGAAPLLGAMVIAAIALSGCARKSRAALPAPVSVPAQTGATETGMASWYGEPYHGRRAASGEVYDMERFTAAHRTLPFNTWVEVTDLDNGKIVNVRITDRGPFVDGRIIDVSLAAARSLDMLGRGTARVRLKIIPAPARDYDPEPAAPATGPYAVQAGAFSDPHRAEAFAASLRDQYKDTAVIESTIRGSTVWRVLIARDLPLDAANRLATKVRNSSGQALVVPNP
jgi:peptidoglycan lytic transglycosylase